MESRSEIAYLRNGKQYKRHALLYDLPGSCLCGWGNTEYFEQRPGGEITRLVKNKVSVSDYVVGKSGYYTLHGSATKAPEIYKWSKNQALKLTSVNDSVMAKVQMGSVEKVSFKSKDLTPIEGFVIKPADFDPAKKYPLILWIHGGPIGQ